jgi:predicted dehydrogenase
MSKSRRSPQATDSRRTFLKQSTAALATGGATLSLARSAYAGGDDLIRIGLIGCGGRGTGAAAQALQADKNVKLVALGDAFADQLQRSLSNLKQVKKIADRIDVSDDACFVGFDAYQKVIDSGVDLVLLATPPQFRPQHLAAAVKAGKHVFAEKPVAVDAPGVRKVLDACAEAKKKNISVVSGLCWRYENFARASIQQIHDGAVGDIVGLECTYNASLPGKAFPMVRESGWSDMEWQMRNWYWFTWLSGDHIVEQAVHSVDKLAWAMHDQMPNELTAVSLGGLQARLSNSPATLGDIYDHHAVTYEFPGGLKLFFNCRQQPGTSGNVSSHVIGTKGVCHIEKGVIESRSGSRIWRYEGKKNIMHQTEHDEMYAGIRSGNLINDGEFMCKSTLLAILGRMASYTGKQLTWEQAYNSQQDLSPAKYGWGDAPKVSVAIPGLTPFV